VRSSISGSNSGRPQRRGRAVLLWALGAFVTIQLAASCVFDYSWPSVRFPAFYQQVARYDADASPPDVLCLGSSRVNSLLWETQVDFLVRNATGDPSFHTFNACVPGGDIIVSERMFRCLIDRGARPRFVLVEVSPEIVNHRAAWLLQYGPWFIRWHEIPAFFHDMIVTRSLLRFAGSRLLPIYYYRDQIRDQLAHKVSAWWTRHATPSRDGKEQAQRRIAAAPGPPRLRHHYGLKSGAAAMSSTTTAANPDTTRGLDVLKRGLGDYRPGGNAAAALERLLGGCREHGIEPILVVVPAPTAHRACYTSEIEASFQTYLADTAHKYSCHCADYHDALPDRFFADHHHAAPAGGLLFTERFSIEVLTPLWKADAP
jgi:hypothetical protein